MAEIQPTIRSRKIYIASSWRNPYQQGVVAELRDAGHEVYDFRHPTRGGPQAGLSGLLDDGFRWSDVDPAWEQWDAESFRHKVTTHALATIGFEQDMAGLEWADTCVLLLPCGRSAHLEAGWAAGAGKSLVILLQDDLEPELMYRIGHKIVLSVEELLETLAAPEGEEG
jgi:hypothetical protein